MPTSAFQSLYGPILSAVENGITEAMVCLPSLMVLVGTGAVEPVERFMSDRTEMSDSMSLAMTVVLTTLNHVLVQLRGLTLNHHHHHHHHQQQQQH